MPFAERKERRAGSEQIKKEKQIHQVLPDADVFKRACPLGGN